MPFLLAISSVLFPALTVPWVITHYFKTRQAAVCAVILGLCIGAIGCGLQHVAVGDITRYSLLVGKYQGVSLETAFNMQLASSPVSTLWFWAIAQTGKPLLLQATTICVEYGIISYLILDFAKRNDWTNKQVITCVLLTICFVPFFFSASALRSTPALLIGMLAFYFEGYLGKHKILAIFLYIVSCLIHTTGFAFIAIRVLFAVFKKRPLLGIGLMVVLIPSTLLLAPVLTPITNALHVDLIGMLTHYTEWTDGYAERVATGSYHVVTKLFNAVFIIYFLIDLLRQIRKRNLNYSDIYSEEPLGAYAMFVLAWILGLMVFIAVPSYQRFTYAVYPVVSLLIVKMHFGSDESRTSDSFPSRVVYIFFAIGFLLLHIVAFMTFVKKPEIILSCLFGLFTLFL